MRSFTYFRVFTRYIYARAYIYDLWLRERQTFFPFFLSPPKKPCIEARSFVRNLTINGALNGDVYSPCRIPPSDLLPGLRSPIMFLSLSLSYCFFCCFFRRHSFRERMVYIATSSKDAAWKCQIIGRFATDRDLEKNIIRRNQKSMRIANTLNFVIHNSRFLAQSCAFLIHNWMGKAQ